MQSLSYQVNQKFIEFFLLLIIESQLETRTPVLFLTIFSLDHTAAGGHKIGNECFINQLSY